MSPRAIHPSQSAGNGSDQTVSCPEVEFTAPSNRDNLLPRKARLFVVDDHPVVRKGLQMLLNLQPDMHVCGEAPGLSTAKPGVATVNPELVIVDLGLEDGDGFELIDWLRGHHPKMKILVFTSQESAASATRAFQCGAHGYVVKSAGVRELIPAIRLILQDRRFLSFRVARQEDPSRQTPGKS